MVRLLTTTGVDALVVVPLPNWPSALLPQHFAAAFANNAHEWLSPAEIATPRPPKARPLTTTGIDELVVVPSPNWPSPSLPQHLAVPFASTAHEWLAPPVIAIALLRLLTTTGVVERVVAPFPNWP